MPYINYALPEYRITPKNQMIPDIATAFQDTIPRIHNTANTGVNIVQIALAAMIRK